MNPYLIFILVILVGSYILEFILDFLNVRHLKTELPAEFEGYYDGEKYQKSQKYLKENTRFGMISDTIMTPLIIIFILVGGFNIVDRFARSFELGPIPTGLIFAGVLILAYHIIHIPFSIYETFIIEEKYGFNKTTVKTFVLDILKTWVLVALIGSILLSIVLWFFEKAGGGAWLYCWAAVVLIQIFLMFIAPVTILPLFNKYTPLGDG